MDAKIIEMIFYDEKIGIQFDKDVDQNSDEVDKYNDALETLFGKDCNIDWRDENCVDISGPDEKHSISVVVLSEG